MMEQVLPGSAYKAYVTVYVEFSADGVMLPRQIVWEDGVKYGIDRVLDIRPSYAPRPAAKGIVIRHGTWTAVLYLLRAISELVWEYDRAVVCGTKGASPARVMVLRGERWRTKQALSSAGSMRRSVF